MRKLVTILFSAGLMFILSLPVQAALYSPDKPTLLGMQFDWNGSNTTTGPLQVIDEGTAIRFAAEMTYGDGTSDGWASMGIGYPWPTSPPVSNLSGYTGYALNFLNTNNSTWFVNVFMNTGWTDSPYSETDRYYENGWVALLPGVSTTVTLNFSSANLYIGGAYQGVDAVVNANHVSNIGFEIGANMDEFPFTAGENNPSNGDVFHIDVSQIPEPATMCLLGLGAVALRRRK
jgi:hypothetical protein